MLTKEQGEKISEAFAKRRGNRPVYEEEAEVLTNFCNESSCHWDLIEAILSGHLLIDVHDGEVVFVCSQDGAEHVEHLLRTDDDTKASWERLNAQVPPPTTERFGPKSLCGRLMLLLYIQKEPVPVEAMARILDATESGVRLALKALQDGGMIETRSDEEPTP